MCTKKIALNGYVTDTGVGVLPSNVHSSRFYLNLKNYDPRSGIMLMHGSKKCHSEVFIQSHRDEVIFRGFLETFS